MPVNNLIRNLQSWFYLHLFCFFSSSTSLEARQDSSAIPAFLLNKCLQRPHFSLTKPTTFSGPLKNPQISPPKIPIEIISRNRESTRWHHEDPVTSRDLEPRVSDTQQSWGTRGISPCPKVREKKIGGPPRSRDAHIADWLKTLSDLPKRCRWKKLRAMFWQRYLFVCSTRWLQDSWNAISPLPVRSANRICQEGIEKKKKKWLMQGIKRRTGQQPN